MKLRGNYRSLKKYLFILAIVLVLAVIFLFHKDNEIVGTRSTFSTTENKAMFERYSNLFKVSRVNCINIFKAVKEDVSQGIREAKEMIEKVPLLSNEYYTQLASSSCEDFIQTRGYITTPLSREEQNFPIAFSILAYKDIEMVERLLRSIYRPQNFYCLHIDAKSDQGFFKAATKIANCLPNVFMASRRVDVIWGGYKVLEPDLVCMKDLFQRGWWRYFINLTGQEMPLKTNHELVKILTAYNGANDIEGIVKRAELSRWAKSYPPPGIKPVKGAVHIVVNRDFVDFMLHNATAQAVLEWVQHTDHASESYFSTLNHNPWLGIPGSYNGVDLESEATSSTCKPFLARFKNWHGCKLFQYPCAGYWQRGICVLSTGDLPLLGTRIELFANKFNIKRDRIALQCLEEKIFNDTRDEYLGTKQFEASYYGKLGFVRDQLRKT